MNMAAEKNMLRGVLKHNEPMARHTSWRVGGPADRYYQPADVQDLSLFLSQLPEDEPVVWVGLGSNLLVRDAGIRGTVVATAGMLKDLSLMSEDTIRAEAGVASAKVARFAAEHELAGSEFLAGIPGSVGGALAMNAGAFGGVTWNIVASVETMDHRGTIYTRMRDDFTVGYRSVKGPENEWFIAGHFKLEKGASADARTEIKRLLAKRGASQPMQTANAGSVFKNPEDDHAARLIESLGLKGVCDGKACISDVHANFIINTGGATAAEIERLIETIQSKVEQEYGVKLEREVRIVGEAL